MMYFANLVSSLADWLPALIVGATFTLVGCLKIYGLWAGVVGGAEKPFANQLCGS